MTLKGIIKNGLDTSRLVNLIVCFDSPDEFKMDARPSPPHIFFINDVSFSETHGILMHSFNMNYDFAKTKIREWIFKLNIGRIKRDEKSEDFEKIVNKSNEEIIEEKGEKYRIGENDIKIIAGFLKEKINIVHLKDKGMEETCKKLKFEVFPTPRRDLKREKSIKERLNKLK